MKLFLPVACMCLITPLAVSANGRMPGASQLKVGEMDPNRLVVQATFGILQSFDRGASWTWICEEAISTAGVVSDPPLATTRDGSIVLLPPVGGTLVSHDQGCTWAAAGAPLTGERAVDLTIDPSDASRVLVLVSTVAGLDADGFATYSNKLVESRDAARTWSVLSSLPADVMLETVEVAGSDPNRLYVSGTSNMRPSLGVALRSEDGGKQWVRTTLELPPGRGSMLISAVDPRDADRLWARVPARGDINGTLPTSLFVSDNKGMDWRQIAATRRGMFGFALSPDGAELAYGGPGDGLFVGPSDGSGFERVNDLTVTCLRWSSPAELYACAAQPPGAFSVGRSADKGRTFEPLYSLADTCPMSCAEGSNSALLCGGAWTRVATLIRASGDMCALPDAGAPAASDAGAMSRPDAAPKDAGSNARPRSRARGESGCSTARADTWSGVWALWLACLAVWRRRRHGTAAWCVLLAVGLLACGGADDTDGQVHPDAEDDDFQGCPEGIPNVAPGLDSAGERLQMKVLDATPEEPERYINDWKVELRALDESPVEDAKIVRAETFMPVHGHDGRVQPRIAALAEPGEFSVERLNFTMRGPWQVRFWLQVGSDDDYVVFDVCVAK